MELRPSDIQFLQIAIIAEIRGEISAPEKQRLQQLMDDNEQARQIYSELYAVLDTEDVTKARQELPGFDQLKQARAGQEKAKIIRVRFYYSAAAALILLIAGYLALPTANHTQQSAKQTMASASSVTFSLGNGNPINLDTNQIAQQANGLVLHPSQNALSYKAADTDTDTDTKGTLNVPAGRFYHLVLSDGSTIQLNSQTKLVFPINFSRNTREIWVDGEAYIDVQKNAIAPFIVHLPQSTVKVLGTSFNVNSYDNREYVSLVSGSVRVVGHNDSVSLSPGKQSLQSAQGLASAPFNAVDVLSWRQGIFHFDNATLESISHVFPRWFGYQVHIDEQVKDKHFYGVIDRNQPIEEFLAKLKLMTNIQYQIKDTAIYISQ